MIAIRASQRAGNFQRIAISPIFARDQGKVREEIFFKRSRSALFLIAIKQKQRRAIFQRIASRVLVARDQPQNLFQNDEEEDD